MTETKDAYCNLYIARHGETEWNVRKLIMGHTNMPLNDIGEQQAQELSEKLKHINFVAAFSSDLLRARRTAEIVMHERSLAVQTKTALRERNYGRFEGQPHDIVRRELFDLLEAYEREGKSGKPYPDVESDEEVTARLIPVLKEIAVAYPSENVLVVAHGGVLRTLLIHLAFTPPGTIPLIKNAAYMKLVSDGVEFAIQETNGIEAANT
jgi:probable phosphoglycerate mutase